MTMTKNHEKNGAFIENIRDLERVMTSPQSASEKDEGIVEVSNSSSSSTVPEALPLSKARCVALVTTVAAAPFLSVSNRLSV